LPHAAPQRKGHGNGRNSEQFMQTGEMLHLEGVAAERRAVEQYGKLPGATVC